MLVVAESAGGHERVGAAAQLAVPGGFEVHIGAVPGVHEGLLGVSAGVGSGLVEHARVVRRVGGAGRHVGGGDDLVLLVDDGLGVVGLDLGAVAVLHDPRVGIGEVGLVLRLRAGFGGSLLAGVDDGLFVAATGALLAAAFLYLSVLAGLVGGLGLDLGAGGLQPREALLATVQLGGQIRVLAIDAEPGVLGGVASASASRAVAVASMAAISAAIRSSLSMSRP